MRRFPWLGALVLGARIVGHVEPGDSDAPGGPGDRHEGVEDRGGRLRLVILAMSMGFEADRVDGGSPPRARRRLPR